MPCGLAPTVIEYLRSLKYGQPIRTDVYHNTSSKIRHAHYGRCVDFSVDWRKYLTVVKLSQLYVWIVLGVMVAFGAVGWVDDFRKIVKKDPEGLPARWKYLWQSVGGLAAAVTLYF